MRFADAVPFYGFVVINADDENCRWVIERTHRRVITFGLREGANYTARELRLIEGRYAFEVWHEEQRLGEVHLGVPGKLNLLNLV